MFFGEFKSTIDDKNRSRIPSKLKSKLNGSYVLTKGINGCIFVFEKAYYETKFLEKLTSVPTFNAKAQKAVRALTSSTYDIDEDSQGRFLMPTLLKEFAGISKNIVFVGAGNRIEIWDELLWQKYFGDTNFDEVAQDFSLFNI